MKSVLHRVANTEFTKTHTTIGSTMNPVKYSKSDYLLPSMVAKKFDITTKQATEFMRILCIRRYTFAVNGHKSPVIIRTGGNSYALHPMAHEIFQEFLEKQRG